MQRRDFIRTGAMTALASQRVLGANDRIGVALIGCGGRGRGVTSYVPKIGGAEVRGVSDVYVPRREQAAEQFGATAKVFNGYCQVKLFGRKWGIHFTQVAPIQDFHFGPGMVTGYTPAAPNTTSFRAEPCTSPPPVGARARPSAHRR